MIRVQATLVCFPAFRCCRVQFCEQRAVERGMGDALEGHAGVVRACERCKQRQHCNERQLNEENVSLWWTVDMQALCAVLLEHFHAESPVCRLCS